jgi:hypothetical protein
MSVLHPVDWVVIIAYFLLIAAIVVWVACPKTFYE